MDIYHINDVIASGDTSVKRLQLQYSLLSNYFGIEPYSLHLISVPFGDSLTTAWKTQETITQNIKTQTHETTICVNNASRAKHTNSKNAKGSPCLRGIQSYQGKTINIVGVDTEVFYHLHQFNPFDTLSIVHDVTINTVTKQDISQGSQFRSLEFFPAVQHCVISKNFDLLNTETVDINRLGSYNHNPSHIQKEYITPTVTHTYEGNLPPLQDIQLAGQRQKFHDDRQIDRSKLSIPQPSYNQEAYHTILKNLKPNELIIIDRDHYGNTKCLSSHINGINGLIQACGIKFEESLHITRPGGADTGRAVPSISCKTGYPCLRNGSSRGPQGETLIELNYSIDLTGKRRDSIGGLPLGTRLSCCES